MKKSIIQKVRQKPHVENEHLALVTGKSSIVKPSYYRNIETGALYSFIAGALEWPGKLPGFALVVAVEKTDAPDPAFLVLEEVETDTIEELLWKCVDLREKWGYWVCSELFRPWWGDYERFYSLISDFNITLQTKYGQAHGFYPSPPVQFERPNKFDIYLNRILQLLKTDDSGKKRLTLGSCNKLRNHLETLPRDAPLKLSVEDFPAAAALGYIVAALMVHKPWQRHVSPVRRKTDFESLALREQDRELRRLGVDNYEFGELDEHESGSLVTTIPD